MKKDKVKKPSYSNILKKGAEYIGKGLVALFLIGIIFSMVVVPLLQVL